MLKFVKFVKVTRKEDGKEYLNVVSDKAVGYPVAGEYTETVGIIKEMGLKEALDKVTLREGEFGLYASISADYDTEELTF